MEANNFVRAVDKALDKAIIKESKKRLKQSGKTNSRLS